MPTSEDGSGRRGQYLIGPEVALGKRTAQGLYGFRLKHLTDVYGQGGQELGKLPTNETTLQVFLAYSFGNGWQLESNPTILYDWEAVSGNQWLVPICGGISKTFSVGKRSMKLGVELQHYIESPERFGPEWLLRVNFIPLVSTKFFQ